MRETDIKKILLDLETGERQYTSLELNFFLKKAILVARDDGKEINAHLINLLNVEIQRKQTEEQKEAHNKLLELVNNFNNGNQSRINSIEKELKEGFNNVNKNIDSLKKTLNNQVDRIKAIEEKSNYNFKYIKMNEPINKELIQNHQNIKTRNLMLTAYSKTIITVAGVIGAIITILAFMRTLI